MAYNQKFYKTESATARCLAGTGPSRSYTASSESIISQRDVDRKALGWAKAAAQSLLRCVIPSPGGVISLSPSTAFSSSGFEGGSFSPGSAAYTLTNAGADGMSWSVSGPAWLSFAPSSGFLYTAESVIVSMSLNGVADGLAPAVYTSPVVFVNDVTGDTEVVSATLTVLEIPVPQVVAMYNSESGTASLIGHPEFAAAGASVPPKKYRIKTASGTLAECVSDALACAGPFSSARYDYSGSAAYNAATGVLTNTLSIDFYSTAGSCPATDFTGAVAQAPTWGDTTVPLASCLMDVTVTKTRVDRVRSGSCCADVPNAGRSTTGTGAMAWDLSDEDSETDALARAVTTPGSSSTAARQARGAGDFSFAFVTVDYALNFTDLAPGKSYDVTLDISTENYGGGGGVLSQRNYSFTASASTHVINDSLTAASGKQVTAFNPQVSLVP